MIEVDRIVIEYEDVPMSAFEEKFKRRLELLECHIAIPEVKYYIGTDYTQYHHNIKIGSGEGAVHIGYKHNTCKEGKAEVYNIRLECNPSKIHDNLLFVFRAFREANFRMRIKHLDLAKDIEVSPKHVIVDSLTGREASRYKNSRYWGTKGKDGRLKVYDKKTEQREKFNRELNVEYLTRIEYTFKPKKPLSLAELKHYKLEIDNQYKFIVFKQLEGLKPEVMSCVLAVLNETYQIKEFSRTNQTKIRAALDSMEQLSFNSEVCNSWSDIHRFVEKLMWGELPTNLQVLYNSIFN